MKMSDSISQERQTNNTTRFPGSIPRDGPRDIGEFDQPNVTQTESLKANPIESWINGYDDEKAANGRKTPPIASAFGRITFTPASAASPSTSSSSPAPRQVNTSASSPTRDASPPRIPCLIPFANKSTLSSSPQCLESYTQGRLKHTSFAKPQPLSPTNKPESSNVAKIRWTTPSTRPMLASYMTSSDPALSYASPKTNPYSNSNELFPTRSAITPIKTDASSPSAVLSHSPASISRVQPTLKVSARPESPASISTIHTAPVPVTDWHASSLTRYWNRDLVRHGILRLMSEINLDFYEDNYRLFDFDGDPEVVHRLWEGIKILYFWFIKSWVLGVDILILMAMDERALYGGLMANPKAVLADMICFFAAGKMGMESRAEGMASALISGDDIISFIQLRCAENGLVYPGGIGRTKERIAQCSVREIL